MMIKMVKPMALEMLMPMASDGDTDGHGDNDVDWVHMGPGNPGNCLNFSLRFSRTGKSLKMVEKTLGAA